MQEKGPIEEYISLDDLPNEGESGFMAKIKGFLGGKYFLVVIIILSILTAFFLGRISILQGKRVPVKVLDITPQPPSYLKRGEEQTNTTPAVSTKDLKNTASVGASGVAGEVVVGSKNGTKYHYPWCAGAKQISEKNLITFASIEEARSKGYAPAANCKGLK